MKIRRPAIFPATTLLFVSLSLGLCRAALASDEAMLPPEEMGTPSKDKTVDVSAEAAAKNAEPVSGRYGDVSLTITESFGRINVPADSERGKSGATQGSGFELRYMMTPGVGAYYRWENAAQQSGDHFDWYVLQYVFGFAGRLHSTGRKGLWTIRTQSRIEWGLLYFQAGTNDVCTRSLFPLGANCSGTPPVENASGAGLGTELRLAGEVDVGPIAFAVDLGATGYRRWSTGSSSVSIPGWFWMPTVLFHVGLALPVD